MSSTAVKLLSLAQAAKKVGLSRFRIWQLINAGRIRAQRLGFGWFVDPDDLRRYRETDADRRRKSTGV